MKTSKIGRDAKSGRFIPVGEAQKRRATAVVETVRRRTRSANPIAKPKR
jgi:hypothetical protein